MSEIVLGRAGARGNLLRLPKPMQGPKRSWSKPPAMLCCSWCSTSRSTAWIWDRHSPLLLSALSCRTCSSLLPELPGRHSGLDLYQMASSPVQVGLRRAQPAACQSLTNMDTGVSAFSRALF